MRAEIHQAGHTIYAILRVKHFGLPLYALKDGTGNTLVLGRYRDCEDELYRIKRQAAVSAREGRAPRATAE